MSLPIINTSTNLAVNANVEVHTNSSLGSFAVTLPVGVEIDEVVKFIDIGRNWTYHPVTVLTAEGNTFTDSTTSFVLKYPGIYEFLYIGNQQWIYFYTTMQDPNIINNVVANGFTSSIFNNTLTITSDVVSNKAPNTVYSGPSSGLDDTPTFRNLVAADLVPSPVDNGIVFTSSGLNNQSSSLTFSNNTVFTPSLNITSSASMGKINLINGTATVNTSKVSGTCCIFLTVQNSNGSNAGNLRISSKINGISFSILSTSPSDNSTVAWILLDSQ
jgi:hypothetical protein